MMKPSIEFELMRGRGVGHGIGLVSGAPAPAGLAPAAPSILGGLDARHWLPAGGTHVLQATLECLHQVLEVVPCHAARKIMSL